MGDLLGLLLALFSTIAAGLVSGLRLKPYIEAGEQFTPPTFALYPALLALAVALPIIFFTFQGRRRTSITIWSIVFTDRQFFAVLWSVLYILIALTLFPYQPKMENYPLRPKLQIVLQQRPQEEGQRIPPVVVAQGILKP